MPLRPKHPCNRPGCTKLTRNRFCEDDERAVRVERGSSARQGYGSEWRQIRAEFIAAHPRCEDCGQPSTDADHVPSRRVLIDQGVTNPDDWQYLHARCHSCHSRKTVTRDRGFGRRAIA